MLSKSLFGQRPHSTPPLTSIKI